jgi:hypothetical protein
MWTLPGLRWHDVSHTCCVAWESPLQRGFIDGRIMKNDESEVGVNGNRERRVWEYLVETKPRRTPGL